MFGPFILMITTVPSFISASVLIISAALSKFSKKCSNMSNKSKKNTKKIYIHGEYFINLLMVISSLMLTISLLMFFFIKLGL